MGVLTQNCACMTYDASILCPRCVPEATRFNRLSTCGCAAAAIATDARFLYNTFVVQAGNRRCCDCYCTFTDETKKMIGEQRFNQLSSNGVLNVTMINTPGKNNPGGNIKVDDSDHPLKEVRGMLV